jgi:hypothetical protein
MSAGFRKLSREIKDLASKKPADNPPIPAEKPGNPPTQQKTPPKRGS